MFKMIDPKVNSIFATNLNRVLTEKGLNVRWLMLTLEENANRIYPACRGETNLSLELAARIASALGVSIDSLVATNKTVLAKNHKTKRAKNRVSRILEKSA